MSSFLVISPYERSETAFETSKPKKKGRSRTNKGWSSNKKKKRSPKKPVAAAHVASVDSYPTVSLVDEFTDTVNFNDSVLQNDEGPSLQLGDFLLVSPNEPTPSDLMGSASSDKVDPLSTNSDGINLDPEDNPQGIQSDELPSFFLFERRNEPSIKIPLNSDGDKLVANILRTTMMEMCSNRIGEAEFNKKNEWIINWRKLRYTGSATSKSQAIEGPHQNLLDYNYCVDEEPKPCNPKSVAHGPYRKKSSAEMPSLPQAKIGSGTVNRIHSGTDLVHVSANNNEKLLDCDKTTPSVCEHSINDQTSRNSFSNSQTVAVDTPNCSPPLRRSSHKTEASQNELRCQSSNITSTEESSVPRNLRKGRHSQISNMAAHQNDSHTAESSHVQRPFIAMLQDDSLHQETITPSGTDDMHEPSHHTPTIHPKKSTKSNTKKSAKTKKARKRRQPQSKNMPVSENSSLHVESLKSYDRSNIRVSQEDTSRYSNSASKPIILDLESTENVLYCRKNYIDPCVSSLGNSSTEHLKASAGTKNVNSAIPAKCSHKTSASHLMPSTLDGETENTPVQSQTSNSGAHSKTGEHFSCKTNNVPCSLAPQNLSAMPYSNPTTSEVVCASEHESLSSVAQRLASHSAAIQGETDRSNDPYAKSTPSLSCSVDYNADSNGSHSAHHEATTGCNTLRIHSLPRETPHTTWRQTGTPSTPISTIDSQAMQNSVISAFCGCQLKHDKNSVGHSSESSLSCNAPKICHPMPHCVISGSDHIHNKCMCRSTSSYKFEMEENQNLNCSIWGGGCCKPQLIACQNCPTSHQNTVFSTSGKPCLNLHSFPSVSMVCNGAFHPMGPQVHGACQHQNRGFPQASPYLHKLESATDPPSNCDGKLSSLPGCMSGKHHACYPSVAHHSCDGMSTYNNLSRYCETSRGVSCCSVGSGKNHPSRVMAQTWPHNQHHSSGRPCNSSQHSFIKVNTTPYATGDTKTSFDGCSWPHNHHGLLNSTADIGSRNSEINCNCGVTGKLVWPSTCAFKREREDDSSMNCHESFSFEPNCMNPKPSFCRVAPNMPQAVQSNLFQKCCSRHSSDSNHLPTLHSPVDGQQMCTAMTRQDSQRREYHLVGRCTPCPPFIVKSETANLACNASSLVGSDSLSYNGSNPMTSYTAVGLNNKGSDSQNAVNSSIKMSLKAGKRACNLTSPAVTLQDDTRREAGVSIQRTVKSIQQYLVRNPKHYSSSLCPPDVPRRMSHTPPENKAWMTNSVSQLGLPIHRVGQHLNHSPDLLVISSDDEEKDENSDALCVGHSQPQNSGFSNNTAGQRFTASLDPMVISSDDEIDQNINATCIGSFPPKNLRQSNDTIGQRVKENVCSILICSDADQTNEHVEVTCIDHSPPQNSGWSSKTLDQPQQSTHTGCQRFNGSLDTMVISSDEEETDQTVDTCISTPVRPVWLSPPENWKRSNETVGHLDQSTTTIDQTRKSSNTFRQNQNDEHLKASNIGHLENSGSTSITGQPQQSISKAGNCLNGSLMSIVISSDDDEE